MRSPKLYISAKAVIKYENSILILHPSSIDSNIEWHIPGGRRDNLEESISETAIREVREETGIDISNIDGKVFKVDEWNRTEKGEDIQILAIFFLYHFNTKPSVKLSYEHDNFAWVNLKNLDEYDVTKQVKEIVLEILV